MGPLLRSVARRAALVTLLCVTGMGCARAPSPVHPGVGGSVGVPHGGVLAGGRELPRRGPGWVWLRGDDRHWGLPRFVDAIERAARKVESQRPGGTLSIGDLSVRRGGRLLPHLSHRTGRDVDLLLYMTTLEGAPVQSPGFIHVGADGLAYDEAGKRWLRLDVERTWLLVKALVEDDAARVQWAFASTNLEAILLEWARARGESGETLLRASEIMLQPRPGGVHDDHLHVRTACTPEEQALGCEHTGPVRRWIAELDAATPTAPPSTEELLFAILSPIGAPEASAHAERHAAE